MSSRPTDVDALAALRTLLAWSGASHAESPAADAIVPFTRVAIAAAGLDYAPALAAAQAGTLRTVFQGRRRLTTPRWLVQYVESLPPAAAAEPGGDDLLRAARHRAARRAS